MGASQKTLPKVTSLREIVKHMYDHIMYAISSRLGEVSRPRDRDYDKFSIVVIIGLLRGTKSTLVFSTIRRSSFLVFL